MQMSKEMKSLKTSVDALLQAHTEFDSALWQGDYEAMTRAQKKIEAARCRAALASRRFEETIEEFGRLAALLDLDSAVELEHRTRL